MNILRIVCQKDYLVLRDYMNEKIYEHVNIHDLNKMINVLDNTDIMRNISKYLIMKPNVKLELWRRTGIPCFCNKDMKYLMNYVEDENEMIYILSSYRIGPYINILEKAVEKKWDNLIKYIGTRINSKLTHYVNDQTMHVFKYILQLCPSFPISTRISEIQESKIVQVRNNLYTCHDIGEFIDVPVASTVGHYKKMLENWKLYPHLIPSSTNGHNNNRYIHHMLFMLILKDDVRSLSWTSHDNYVFYVDIMDYLAHEYPNSIMTLWNKMSRKSTLLNLLIINYPAYLPRNTVQWYWNKYYRLHIHRPITFSDIILRSIM